MLQFKPLVACPSSGTGSAGAGRLPIKRFHGRFTSSGAPPIRIASNDNNLTTFPRGTGAHRVLKRRCRLASLALLVLPHAEQSKPPWDLRSAGTSASFRGLSVVDDLVIWASGTRGTVVRSTDGGTTWTADTIPGASRLDVRAIHGRSGLVAHAAATAGRIWRTTDGGRTWSLRYQAADTAVFLDAIVFLDDRTGLALGDPMGGRFLILVTRDGGESWHVAPVASRPAAKEGEAAFAASGTSLVVLGTRHAWLGTGGTVARVFRSGDGGVTWTVTGSGLADGSASTGVFSLAFADTARGVAVGGDYQRPDSATGTAATTADGGRTWAPATAGPRGYRSGVAAQIIGGRLVAIAVGTSGSDVSLDGGRTWSPLDVTAFNSIQFAPGGVAFAVGGQGRIARLDATRLTPPK